MKKAVVTISLILLLFGVFALSASAETVDSGTCGDNLTWTLDDEGTLTISGQGNMINFNYIFDHGIYYTTAPWGGSLENANRIKTVMINSGVTSIGNYAFYRCTGLTSVTIPNNVTDIGGSAFCDCTGLTNVTIPNSVTSIGESAFSGCTGLTSVSFPGSVTSIGRSAFYHCEGLTSVTIPDNVTVIGKYAFCGCSSLKSATIGNGVTTISGFVFLGCKKLTTVKIPDSITSIGDSAFFGCVELTSITIPNNVTSIEDYAFSSCMKLTSVAIPGSVTNIGKDAFYYCSGLDTITVPAGNPNYASVNNCLIEKSSKTLILGCKNSVIPADGSVTSIGESAFSGCTGLMSVSIPSSVTSIGKSVFIDCTGLTSIAIPNSVTVIGSYAFKDCTGLTSITIPNNVTNICDGMFYKCKGLTNITIPYSVTNISDCAFYDCTGLTNVYYTGSEENWKAIDVGTENECLQNVKIHYNYELTACEHAWELTATITPAGCTVNGGGEYTCSKCGTEKTDIIPARGHDYKNIITKATLTKDGKIVSKCTRCGAIQSETKIAKASKISISKTKFVYSGKVQKPTLTVKDSAGKAIDSKYYTVKWSNASSKAVGSYTVTVTFKGNYSGTKTLTYTIVPKQVTGVKDASAETKSIKLSWTKATGAKYYEVYGSTDGKTFKKITTVSTNSVKITKVNGKALAAGKTYYFKVRAMDSSKKLIGAYSKVLKTGTLTAAPKITKLTSSKAKTATVTWGKVTGAKSYAVYKSTDGKKWTKVASTAKTTCTLTKLTGGKPIYVKVLAVNAYSQKSAFSAVKSVTVKK